MDAAYLYDLRTSSIASDREAIKKLCFGFDTLEVGCGTGRILNWLVDSPKNRLAGIEKDGAKLKIAKGKPLLKSAANLTLVHADFLRFKSPQKFDRILFAFNVLCEFVTVEKRITALKHSRKLLKPRGQIIIMVSPHDFSNYDEKETHHKFKISSGRETWSVQIDCLRNHLEQTSHCTLQYKNRHSVVKDSYVVSLMTRNELLATYHAAGLILKKEYGSFDLKPLHAESPVLIHVLETRSS